MLIENELEEDEMISSAYVGQLCKERDEAVNWRAASGLDDIWRKAREQYQGIDEVNRSRAGQGKSTDLDGPLMTTTLGKVDRENRSTVFLNVTRPYTNSGTSRVTDIMLPAGNKMPWGLKQTPVSELAILTEVLTDFPELSSILPMELQEKIQARESGEYIKVAEKYIADALVETKWSSALKEVINEAGQVGTGVLKGPFPKRRRLSSAVSAFMQEATFISPLASKTMELRLLYQPAAECVKVENLYPDPACGSDIHKGKFIWERIPDQSEKEIRDLLVDPTYFEEEIEKVLKEKPKDKYEKKEKKSFTIWLRTGLYNQAKLFSAEEPGEEEDECYCFGQLIFINDRLVKHAELPLDEQDFPYRLAIWERRPDSWAGIGIPEQIETPQRGLNAAVRAGNDNLAFSVGFMILIREGLVEPFEGDNWDIHPYKKLRVISEQLSALVGKELRPEDAFKAIEFPNHLNVILPWIEFWLRMAEQTSGLPLLLQGQRSSDSVGVTQLLTNNATSNLRLFIGRLDEDVITPFIQDCFSWIQKYGPASAKGDAVAYALGSAALIVRETQLQALVQFGDRVVNPVYGKSPKKYANLFLEANQLDPTLLDIDEEEMQQLQAEANRPDPRVEAENIRAQSDLQVAQLRAEVDQLRIAIDAQFKNASLEQARDELETKTATDVAKTAMKNEGDLQKQQAANMGQRAGSQMKEGEDNLPDVDSAMKILGL